MSDTVTRRRVNVGIGASLLTTALAGTRAFAQGTNVGAKSNRPNIVFFLADNAGWGDLGVYGGMTPTPRIDALASQGIRFNNYNVEPQCTPTRSAILTGRPRDWSDTRLRIPLPRAH
jgi:arylsulfatase